MQHSDQPQIELERARSAIVAMQAAVSLDHFEESWKEYLRRLERVWTKSEHHFGKSPRWNGWKGKYEKDRKKDALLSYLINARGADEHTVDAIIDRQAPGIGINAAEGNNLHIRHMVVKNGHMFIDAAQPIRIEFMPERTTLRNVKNRGRDYGPPTSHGGNPINPNDIVSVATAGLGYYSAFLDAAEKFFVG